MNGSIVFSITDKNDKLRMENMEKLLISILKDEFKDIKSLRIHLLSIMNSTAKHEYLTYSTKLSFITLKNLTIMKLNALFKNYKENILKNLGVTYKFLNESYQFNITILNFDYQAVKEVCSYGQMELHNGKICCMFYYLNSFFYLNGMFSINVVFIFFCS